MTKEKSPIHEPETILKGIAKEILDSDEFKQKLAELGPEKIRGNIANGLARLEARRMEQLKQYAQYIQNTAQRPLAVATFDEDWEPAGPKLRALLLAAGLVEQWGGALMLTDKGEGLLS